MTFFQAKRFRPFRAAMFIALGLFGAVPAVHGYMVHGAEIKHALFHSITMGLVYMVGPFSMFMA